MTDRIKPQALKGFRDFLPAQALKRKYLIDKTRQVFELYGFLPIETPALEYLETFTGNIGADEKLFFKFTDQGDRNVALRYDQTVPTCRYIALYKNELVFPFKRYQIQTVWRSEKPQKGRYREFLQCDADIFGISQPEADAETIALTMDLFKNFGFKNFIVKINDREILKEIPYPVLVAIDKLAKIGEEKVVGEIIKANFSKDQAWEFLNKIKKAQPNERLQKIFSLLKNLGFSDVNFQFDPTIIRSFNYSSGPIWEVMIPEYPTGSVLGGERYDKLIGKFLDEDVPATGFALGFDRTMEAMEQLSLLPSTKTNIQVLVTVFNQELLADSAKIATELRKNKINTDLFIKIPTKLDKQLKYADKLEIPFAVIVGPEEVKKNVVKLKNMKTGEQKEIPFDQLVVSLQK